MTFEIINEVGFSPEFSVEDLVNDVILAALDFEKCPFEVEISVTITDDARIREINKIHRNLDKPTDVLSFPLNDFFVPGDFESLEMTGCFNPQTGELMLGDIVISADRLRAQSVEYGHSEKRELAFLIVHSVLHLCGYDHMEDDERVIMEEKQEVILNESGYNRER